MSTNEQVVFAIARGENDTVPTIFLGVSREAWVYMKEGRTHTFDLTRAGVPVKLVMFGAKDREEAKRILLTGAGNAPGEQIVDATDQDWSVKPQTKASDHQS